MSVALVITSKSPYVSIRVSYTEFKGYNFYIAWIMLLVLNGISSKAISTFGIASYGKQLNNLTEYRFVQEVFLR